MSYRRKEQSLSMLPGLKSFLRILNELPDLQAIFPFICFHLFSSSTKAVGYCYFECNLKIFCSAILLKTCSVE